MGQIAPENYAFYQLPYRLLDPLPHYIITAVKKFIEQIFLNNEESKMYLLALLCAALYSSVVFQREYFIISRGNKNDHVLGHVEYEGKLSTH